MTDSQWPRFEVFEQERPGEPHRNAGAVHAPDAEMALQNARDVFVRRPETHSLWVAPAEQVFSRTAEELAENEDLRCRHPRVLEDLAGLALETYLVFQKQTQRQGDTFVVHVGEVNAPTAEAALARALDRFGGPTVYVWWVAPERAMTRSDPGDAEALFSPALGKPFRLPKNYHVHAQMREVTASPGMVEPAAPQEREPAA